MGHLDGGHERDVRTESYGTYSYPPSLLLSIDQGPKQDSIATMACFYPYILVSVRLC